MTTDDDVKLRAMEPEDLDLLYQIENDRQTWDIGTTNVPYSRYLLHDYIATAKGDIYQDQQVRLVVENGAGETVGLADIQNFDAKNRRAEVGIIIACKYRRQGYASRVLDRIADYSLHVLHLHQLYAVVSADNVASCQLFRKAGFRQTAVLGDWLYDGKDYHEALLMQLLL